MTFKEQVIEVVRKIPRGRVVSYGQVAAAIGSPRGARQVGWALHTLDGDHSVPWWRVINNEGRISIKGNMMSTPLVQKKFLESEGIKVSKSLEIEIEKYRHHFASLLPM
ncbi:MAG TPA: methylated-DNA--[protein]-cysteine S-methyltransferase [Candidatus Doudnabacteria bacterium]|nr:methylated-DNA--[protein]-cysteine S-methyltransferase [Candidatus Doudnabacteria bacterium]